MVKDPDEMTLLELLERADQVYNNAYIDESPRFWIGEAMGRVKENNVEDL